jgi:hypothetical protein
MAPHDPTNPPDVAEGDEQCITIEVSGANVVVRSSAQVDRASTMSLANVVNAATDTNTCVVIDPEPIRCDDAFASYVPTRAEQTCPQHPRCRAAEADVAAIGVVRLRTESSVWLIDVGKGRFCQADSDHDVHFLTPDAWRPLVAVCVTPTRLIALGADGEFTSARRAHPSPN